MRRLSGNKKGGSVEVDVVCRGKLSGSGGWVERQAKWVAGWSASSVGRENVRLVEDEVGWRWKLNNKRRKDGGVGLGVLKHGHWLPGICLGGVRDNGEEVDPKKGRLR